MVYNRCRYTIKDVIAKKNFNVDSYGTGDKVKLPGPAADRPNGAFYLQTVHCITLENIF